MSNARPRTTHQRLSGPVADGVSPVSGAPRAVRPTGPDNGMRTTPDDRGDSSLSSPRTFPLELFDGEESGYADGIARHWLRADRYTRGQAKYAARHDIDDGADNDWRKFRVRKVFCRYDEQWIAEMIADGSTEPYDGWQLMLCNESDEGAVAYWEISGGVADA